jgi:hypothetical protein
VQVGQWLVFPAQNMAVQIVSIISQSPTGLTFIAEDVSLSNILNNPIQSGQGIGNTSEPGQYDCLIINLNVDGLPVFAPINDYDIPLNLISAIISRFQNWNYIDQFIPVYQPGNTFAVGDVIWLATDGTYYKSLSNIANAVNTVGTVSSINKPGTGWFTFQPSGRYVENLPTLPGLPGQLLYVSSTTPGGLTDIMPGPYSIPVYLKVSNSSAIIFRGGGSSVSGASGFSGFSGINGLSGYSGFNGPTGPASAIPWILKTSEFFATNGDRIIANTSGGTFTVHLPASPITGDYVQITDGGNFEITPLNVGRNGSTIEGLTDDVLLTITTTTYEFIYSGSTWEITATTGAQGPTGPSIQGPSGVSGSSGYSGISGYSGYSGFSGYSGISFVATFETVSKNLNAYPASLNYTGSTLTSVVYTTPSGSITKTLNYTGSTLTSIVLSGATPGGINLTKTLTYSGGNLTGISYS